jgi:aldehyde:ferredoxin oxidoreductase
VLIEDAKVSFLDAQASWGGSVGETVDLLEQQLGGGLHVAAIGPAGENLVRFASIVTNRTHQAARMGLGAVMGSKKSKSVVLRGGALPPVADSACLERIMRSFEQRIPANQLSHWQNQPPGFSCWLHLHGLDAALCVNNYSRSTIGDTKRFEESEFLKRVQATAPCPGCPNDCIKTIHPITQNEDLDPRASGIHQEVTGTMGPNLGITDLDWVLRANNLCNQAGLDPVSLGFTISFAMELAENGLLEEPRLRFGNSGAAERLIGDIVQRRGLGDVLADGCRLASRRMGPQIEHYAMHVKGLEMVCFEPRSQTGLALGYATAPVGPRYDICEHDWDFNTEAGWEHSLELAQTLGITERIPMSELSAEKVRRYKQLSTVWSAADCLGFCIFAVAPTRILSLPEMAEILSAVTGWKTSDHEIMRLGERRNQLLRLYNNREGICASDDTLPARFFEQPITEGPRKGDVLDRGRFREMVQIYYALMGRDEAGIPLDSTLLEHRLND